MGIVVIICASLKLLHLLGLIDFSEGKVVAYSPCLWSGLLQNQRQKLQKLRKLKCYKPKLGNMHAGHRAPY